VISKDVCFLCALGTTKGHPNAETSQARDVIPNFSIASISQLVLHLYQMIGVGMENMQSEGILYTGYRYITYSNIEIACYLSPACSK
jgi:hypothetical protein